MGSGYRSGSKYAPWGKKGKGIGAECWRLLAAGSSVAEMVETVSRVYAVPRERVAADISALIDELCRSGLLQRDYKHVA